MCRVLVFVCLIGFAVAQCPNNDDFQNWPFAMSTHKQSAAGAAVKEIKRLLLEVEQKMRRFCTAHTKRIVEEKYGSRHYGLRVNLTGFTEDSITVRTGQRMVVLRAKNCQADFISLRLLPEIVDSTNGFWRFQNNHLMVFFSYVNINVQGTCGRIISDTVRELPKVDGGDPDVQVNFIVRDETTDESNFF